jgi:hypothetical protein
MLSITFWPRASSLEENGSKLPRSKAPAALPAWRGPPHAAPSADGLKKAPAAGHPLSPQRQRAGVSTFFTRSGGLEDRRFKIGNFRRFAGLGDARFKIENFRRFAAPAACFLH